MTSTKTRPAILAGLLVPLALACGCSRESAEEVESETAVSVRTAPATLGDIRGVVHATGMVRPAPGADLVIVAPEPARVAEIPHASGDRVKQGDLLVRFEIPGSAAEVQRQQAEVNRSRSGLETARAAQARARELFEKGVAARRDIEDADRAVADAEAMLAEAEASLAAARTIASRATVRATFDGIVATRNHNPGDLAEASASDPVLRVIDPRRLEVFASVPLADAPRVEVGASARLIDAPTSDAGIAMKVLSRPTAVEEGTASVPIRLALPGSINLPVGAPVQLEIEAELHTGAVLIPSVAIVREGEETAVFVANAGKAQRRPVKIGLTDGTRVEILSGVKAGESVIVDGQAGLPDGASINIAGPAAQKAGEK
jgi:membrane fusion protein (multidrug efflux system)